MVDFALPYAVVTTMIWLSFYCNLTTVACCRVCWSNSTWWL